MTVLTIPQDTGLAPSDSDPWGAARLAWLNAKEGRTGSAHTRRSYDKALGDWLDFLADLGRHPGQAGGVEVEAYRQSLVSKNKSPATVAQRLAAISSFYQYCQHRFTLQDPTGREVTGTISSA